MKAYILCNGKSTRFEGIKKHLIEIEGESLLDRTIRLLKANKITDITIVGDDKRKGCKTYVNSQRLKSKAFIEVAEKAQGPFVILLGDCYYTDDIIKDAATRKCDKWLHYENPINNTHTGKPYGEGYIHLVNDCDWWIEKLTEYHDKIDKGEIDPRKGNDWMIQRFLYGWDDLYTHQNIVTEYDVLWDDETDDFDNEDDLKRFCSWTGLKGEIKWT